LVVHAEDPRLKPILHFLYRSRLISHDREAHFEPLTGGVSSDIWLVRSGETSFCVKRALPQLRVSAEWLAPVSRNASEVSWLTRAAEYQPDAVPRVLAADASLGVFAMEYLPPSSYELWKARLRRGIAEPSVGSLVGLRLSHLHRAFAESETAAADFPNDATFYALRLEPYLIATARVHPELAVALEELAHITATTKASVVHGDISPKNILIGPRGPVFLDAECAWYGDPAFDLAFCLNHLLLKTLWVPSAAVPLLETFAALRRSYLDGVTWEPARSLEMRAARLLPGLLLARVDGKSPVEYLVDDDESKNVVRRVARALLLDPPDRLEDIERLWQRTASRV
jgi:fructosamine-3-kinase